MTGGEKMSFATALRLCKPRIAAFAALCTACGYVMGLPIPGYRMLLISISILLLAGGALSLNQVQERDLDGLLKRTRMRPLPSGECSPKWALILSALLITTGLGISLFCFGNATFILSAAALLWYNAVYTPLKRVSAFAAVPGALTGALPPLIGWIAAGRSAVRIEILGLMLFLFIWQLPHFWLHFLYSREDYAGSGLPAIIDVFSDRQLRRITHTWIMATGAASLLLAGFVEAAGITFALLLIATIIFLIIQSMILTIERDAVRLRWAFMLSTAYGAAVVLFIALDQLAAPLMQVL